MAAEKNFQYKTNWKWAQNNIPKWVYLLKEGRGKPVFTVFFTSSSLVFFLKSLHFIFSVSCFKKEAGALLRIVANIIQFQMLFSNKQTVEKLRMGKYKQSFLKCCCTGKHMFWVKLSSFLVTILTLWWPWPAGIWRMESSSLYQIKSKEEEHVFRVFFFFLTVFLEGNLERASRGWEDSWKDHFFFWAGKKDSAFVKENLFKIVLFIYFCLNCGTGMKNQAEHLYLLFLKIFSFDLVW